MISTFDVSNQSPQSWYWLRTVELVSQTHLLLV